MQKGAGDHVKVPAFTIEGTNLPIMLCGSAPFIGMGYFGFKAVDYRIKFYKHPDSMADIFIHFVKKGCKGIHVLCYDNIVKAVKIAYNIETFPVVASLNPKEVGTQLKTLSTVETVLAFVHPSQTDSLDTEVLSSITKQIRDAGMIPGFATNAPGTTIPALDAVGIDAAAYLVSVNKEGKYMVPGKDQVVEAVTKTQKTVIAENVLAGEIPPEEGIPFVVNCCNAFSLGFTSKDQIDAAYKILSSIK